MFKKAVFYLYFRIWDMHSRGENASFGAFLAIVTISLLFWLNIFTFIGFLIKIDVIPISLNKMGSMSIGFCLFILNYLIFIHNKKYLEIIAMFKDEPKNIKIRNSLLVLLYILLSVVAIILLSLYKPGKI